jgi:hypothetical protein
MTTTGEMRAVHESANVLSAWENFYVIVGSSGGALIGLQFVVITLIAGRSRAQAQAGALSAFGTPTVVHLVGALLVSAIMSAPWPSLGALAATLGVFGLSGLGYSAVVFRRARRQTGYQPVWQDWIWYAVLPAMTYAGLTVTAAVVRTQTRLALFAVASVALGLLLIGIHNAWDTVTHIVVSHPDGE